MISVAYAQDGGGGGGALMSFLPLILIFVVFYLLLIRPQQRRMKQHREMLGALRRGDRVVTGGGIVGQIVRVKGTDELTVEIADGVRVNVLRGTISAVLARPEPATSRAAERAERAAEAEEAAADEARDGDEARPEIEDKREEPRAGRRRR